MNQSVGLVNNSKIVFFSFEWENFLSLGSACMCKLGILQCDSYHIGNDFPSSGGKKFISFSLVKNCHTKQRKSGKHRKSEAFALLPMNAQHRRVECSWNVCGKALPQTFAFSEKKKAILTLPTRKTFLQ